MTAATVYNTTPGPLVIDAEGRTVAGHERRDNVDTDGPAGRLLDAGLLLDVTEKAPSSSRRPARGEQAPTDADEE